MCLQCAATSSVSPSSSPLPSVLKLEEAACVLQIKIYNLVVPVCLAPRQVAPHSGAVKYQFERPDRGCSTRTGTRGCLEFL